MARWQMADRVLRVMEALHIRRLNCGPGKGMNEDMGSYVTTNQWQPILNKLVWGGEGPGIDSLFCLNQASFFITLWSHALIWSSFWFLLFSVLSLSLSSPFISNSHSSFCSLFPMNYDDAIIIEISGYFVPFCTWFPHKKVTTIQKSGSSFQNDLWYIS